MVFRREESVPANPNSGELPGPLPARQIVAVAYSGGRDSTALLHATARAAKPLGMLVLALHVHHGLSAQADAWLAHCQEQCTRWRRAGWPVRFVCSRLDGKPRKGESVEAWAREQRYRALGAMALQEGASLILLAHHRLDQAETFVLQALRGAGVAGLAAMPERFDRAGATWSRPWLHRSREMLETYVRRYRLRYVEDDSNTQERFTRNRLRLKVWPALQASFPQAEAMFAMSAQWAHSATSCLEELAALDMDKVCSNKGLKIEAWRELSASRRSNVLRAWLATQCGPGAATASLTSRLFAELEHSREGLWDCSQGLLRLYRGVLSYRSEASSAVASGPEERISVLRSGDYKLPGWAGRLRVRRCQHGGVPLAWLAQLDLRNRVGGEQFQSGIGRPPRSLKKQYQAAAVAQWERTGPLFYSGGQLVFVPGLGLDARLLALPGQPQVTLSWLPEQPH